MLPFAGRHPRRASAGATRRRVIQTPRQIGLGDPGARSSTRRARAMLVKSARFAFARELRPVSCPVHASGTRRAQAGVCSSRFAGPPCGNARRANATGIGWCRRVAGRKLHSRARIDGSSGVPVRQSRLQKSANDAEVQRSVLTRWQRDTWTGTRVPGFSARNPLGAQKRRTPAPRWPSRSAGTGRSRALERALRGKGLRSMEGTSGRLESRLVHASGRKATSAALSRIRGRASVSDHEGEATGVSEVRFARIAAGRQRPPR